MHSHDHVLRFRFESEKRADIAHVCDLAGFSGYGECSCEDYTFRVLPVLVRSKCGDLLPKRCKHLEAAREALVDQIISRISES